MDMQAVQPILNSFPWLVTLILGLVYLKPICSVLTRLAKAKFSNGSVEFEVQKQLVGKLTNQNEEITNVLRDIDHKIEKIVQNEKPYNDYHDALPDAERLIISCLKAEASNIQSKVDTSPIEIKIIAVSMTFSWGLIRYRLPKMLKDYPDARINIEVLLVDSTYLESLDLENYDFNWAEESKQRVKQVNDFVTGLPEPLSNRLTISARLYKNLPHWHGILINNECLFIGRTDWEFPTGKPKLSVGQNKYRYFDRSSSLGSERINLFVNWHKYYFQFASKPTSHVINMRSRS